MITIHSLKLRHDSYADRINRLMQRGIREQRETIMSTNTNNRLQKQSKEVESD